MMDGTVATVLGIIGALMTVISILVAVFTFYFNRKKDANSFMRYCNQRKREDDEHYDYEYFHIVSSPFYEVW